MREEEWRLNTSRRFNDEKISPSTRHKKRALRPGLMMMTEDARKLDFPVKFDAVWMGPYLVHEVFPTIPCNWKH